jgi:hypothetical protein
MEDPSFLSIIYKGNLLEIYSYMYEHKTRPWQIVDSRRYTILHLAALDNNTEIIQFFFDYVRDNYSAISDKILREWV